MKINLHVNAGSFLSPSVYVLRNTATFNYRQDVGLQNTQIYNQNIIVQLQNNIDTEYNKLCLPRKST